VFFSVEVGKVAFLLWVQTKMVLLCFKDSH
jgi:hypothetical protein